MRIIRLSIERFRSYQKCDVCFGEEDMHMLTGPNGAGKTNVIEALGILSEAHSFITSDEGEAVAWGESFYRVSGDVRCDTGECKELEVVCERTPRKRKGYFLQGVRVPSQHFIGTLPTVVFLPQDLSLFSGPPSGRRRIIDRVLGQISPEFRHAEEVYGKALKQRSALLKNIVKGTGRREDLVTWNVILAHEGAAITLRRLELLELLQCTLAAELQRLGEMWSDAAFRYERKSTERTLPRIEAQMLQGFEDSLERDLLLQSTTVGPHRDDWDIIVMGRSLSSFASRGQQRSAVLALLFLLGGYMELQRGEKPVILLDDVLSELDQSHQEALLSSFSGHQVIITTTHIPEDALGGVRIWNVKQGKVMERAVSPSTSLRTGR